MRKVSLLSVLALGLALVGCSNKTYDGTEHGATLGDEVIAESEATIGRYGAALTVSEATAIKALNETPKAFLDRSVRIEGKVVGVCKGSGCWVRVQQADGSTVIAKSLDHSVSVPTDCEGRSIVVQGVFKNMAEPAHKATDEHEAGGEPHECPEPDYLLTLDGAELLPTTSS